jgi:hypothetical protein
MSDIAAAGADKEVQDNRLNIYNLVLSYVVEMNENRSHLYVASGVTPQVYRAFLGSFYKLYTFGRTVLTEKLRNEIAEYFNNNPSRTDHLGKKGIILSLALQKELEDQRMITLYEETIVPPFIEIGEEEGDVFMPPFMATKTMNNLKKKVK